jgi:carbamoyl-phosphate synthase large subunit
VLFTETLQKKLKNSPLPYVESTNPPEVKSWREFVPSSATQ